MEDAVLCRTSRESTDNIRNNIVQSVALNTEQDHLITHYRNSITYTTITYAGLHLESGARGCKLVVSEIQGAKLRVCTYGNVYSNAALLMYKVEYSKTEHAGYNLNIDDTG